MSTLMRLKRSLVRQWETLDELDARVQETIVRLEKNQSTESDEYELEQRVNVPEILEEIVEVVKPLDLEIPQERIVEQITDVPATGERKEFVD